MDLQAELDLALELADIANRITLSHFRAADLRVETKSDTTPVTPADREAERAIRERLTDARPGHGVVGEEFGTDGSDDVQWILDPVDGTANFVRGIPVWATLIGLAVGGEMSLGVVSAPAIGHRWWAGRGLGAFRNGEPVSVSAVSDLSNAQLSHNALSTAEEHGIGPQMLDLEHRCSRTRGYGDFWSFRLVAKGAVDVAVEPVAALWDLAPLQVIVEEAGGRFTDLTGRRTVAGGTALATNGRLHEAALGVLTRSQSSS
jgi:histidinol-phosphatase